MHKVLHIFHFVCRWIWRVSELSTNVFVVCVAFAGKYQASTAHTKIPLDWLSSYRNAIIVCVRIHSQIAWIQQNIQFHTTKYHNPIDAHGKIIWQCAITINITMHTVKYRRMKFTGDFRYRGNSSALLGIRANRLRKWPFCLLTVSGPATKELAWSIFRKKNWILRCSLIPMHFVAATPAESVCSGRSNVRTPVESEESSPFQLPIGSLHKRTDSLL